MRGMTFDPIRSAANERGSAPDGALDPQIRQFVSAMAEAWTRYPPADTLSTLRCMQPASATAAPAATISLGIEFMSPPRCGGREWQFRCRPMFFRSPVASASLV